MKSVLLVSCILLSIQSFAQTCDELKKELEMTNQRLTNLRHNFNQLNKAIDDLMWYNKVGDIAFIDKVELTGPPLRIIKNPTGQGAKNPVRFKTYVFIPQSINPDKKYPLLVLPHGGVHS